MKVLSNVQKNDMCGDSPTIPGTKSPFGNATLPKKNPSKKQLKATPAKMKGDASTSRVPKRPRMSGLSEERKLASPEKENFHKSKKVISMPAQWFAFYGDEESEEDVEPLVNNRTERRKKEKQAKLNAALPDAHAGSIPCSKEFHEGSKHITTFEDRKKAFEAPPPPLKSKIIYILDD